MAALASFLAVVGTASAFALGGPVIIGGDDFTDHGSYDAQNDEALDGWLYIQRAIENIKPNVTRSNDGIIASLGSTQGQSDFSDAGRAIERAAAKTGLTVAHYNTGAEIEGFFDALDAGTIKPAIIYITGDGASNDLGDDFSSGAALAANATTIGDFVNSGGGLLSHGSEYGWLFGLLPDARSVNSGGDGDLELTPAGQAAFPGLTNANVNAGPWHNYFEGDLGGLATLVRSNFVNDSTGSPARVVVGGASVVLPGTISLDPTSAQNPVGTDHTVTATVRRSDGTVLSGKTVTFTVTSGPNAGDTGTGNSDAQGQATFTWTGDGGAGTDTVTASFVDDQGATQSTTATKTWTSQEGPSGSASCSNGIDDDADGQTDGADSGCQTVTPPPAGKCYGRVPTITGDGVVNGTPGDDVILTGNGHDTVRGGGGNDLICTGKGADYVRGGAGNDHVTGEMGHDDIGGGAGHDVVEGGTGDDVVRGDDGDDIVRGGSGNDALYGGRGKDVLSSGSGNDHLNGGPDGPDSCDGGPDRDVNRGGCETTANIP